jgi:hypothetical protein
MARGGYDRDVVHLDRSRAWLRRPDLAGIVALLLSSSVAGCVLVDNFPGIRIKNGTEGRIAVTYLLPNGNMDSLFGEIEIAPGESTLETGIFRAYADQRGCVPGTLVAERDGQRIAMLPGPCEDTTWDVREPGTESTEPSP